MITKIKIRNFMTLLMSISLVIISLLNAEAAPGDLDSTFGVGGKVMTQTGYDDKANAATIQADGKIVTAGERRIENSNYHYALLSRYNPDGPLDSSFGTNGDRLVPSDFDGDGRTDVGVFRPSNGVWYLLRSLDGGLQV